MSHFKAEVRHHLTTTSEQELCYDSGLEDCGNLSRENTTVGRGLLTPRKSLLSAGANTNFRPPSVGYHSRPVTSKYRQVGFEGRLRQRSITKCLERITLQQDLDSDGANKSTNRSPSRSLSASKSSHYQSLLHRFRPNSSSSLWYDNPMSSSNVSRRNESVSFTYALPCEKRRIPFNGKRCDYVKNFSSKNKSCKGSELYLPVSPDYKNGKTKVQNDSTAEKDLDIKYHNPLFMKINRRSHYTPPGFVHNKSRPSTCPVQRTSKPSSVRENRPSSEKLPRLHPQLKKNIFTLNRSAKRTLQENKYQGESRNTNSPYLTSPCNTFFKEDSTDNLTAAYDLGSIKCRKNHQTLDLQIRIKRIQRMYDEGLVEKDVLDEIIESIRRNTFYKDECAHMFLESRSDFHEVKIPYLTNNTGIYIPEEGNN